MFEKIYEYIKKHDKILIGIGSSFYGTDLISENIDEWETIKEYLSQLDNNCKKNQKIFNLVQDKDYFIITSSFSSNLQKYFNTSRYYTPNGNCYKLQCYNSCTSETWNSFDFVENSTVPLCPHCKSDMVMNISKDAFFISDIYKFEENNYYKWLHKNYSEKLLIIEIEGTDFERRIIGSPFENIATALPKATFLRINSGDIKIPKNIKRKKSFKISPDELINIL